MGRTKEVFFYFLKLGMIGFGGPLALVSSMQQDLIEKKNWMDLEDFKKSVALIKAMPGAFAFQVAVFLGRHRAGFWGAVLAGLALILPSFLLTIFVGSIYSSLSQNQIWIEMMKGLQIAAITLIAVAVIPLSRSYWKEKIFWILFIMGLPCFFYFPTWEPLLIFLFGGLAIFLRSSPKNFPKASFFSAAPLPIIGFDLATLPLLGELFWICFKGGAFVFGTGLAIVPLLEQDFVVQRAWLTHQEFMDAVAFGQMTPGPFLITVTWIGFKMAGFSGALTATVAVFLPGFIHMTTWFPKFVNYLSQKKPIKDFTLGAISFVVASLSTLSAKSFVQYVGLDTRSMICLGFSLVLIFYAKAPSWLTLLSGGLVSLIFYSTPKLF